MGDVSFSLPSAWFDGPDAIFQGGVAEVHRVIRDALKLASATRRSTPMPPRQPQPTARIDNRTVKGVKRTCYPILKRVSVGIECTYCGDDIYTRNYRARTLKSSINQAACSLQCALNLGGDGWKMKTTQ